MRTLTPLHSVLDRMLTMSRAIEGADPEWQGLRGLSEAGRPAVWFPPMDTWETENTFVIEMDVPGVHLENVEISFEQNTLTIKGERPAAIKTPEKGELRVFNSERAYGTFARSIRLPEYVDGERIQAQFNNGVLSITIPKAAAAMPRKIRIQAAHEVENR